MVNEKDEKSVQYHFEELAKVSKAQKIEIFKTILLPDKEMDSKLKYFYFI